MKAFTHDLESTILPGAEMAAFAGIVQRACVVYQQHAVSQILEGVTRPWCETAATFMQARATEMWRTTILSRPPENGEPASL